MTENHTPPPESQPNVPGPASGAPPEGRYPPYGREYGYGYGYADAYGPDAGLFGHITLGRLWRLLRRQKALILSATAFGLVTAYYLVQNTSVEIYRATSVIEMSLRKPRVLDQKGEVADEGYASSQEAFETRLDRFTSPAMRAVVVEKLREIRKNDARSDPQLSDILAGGVTIGVRGGTRLVNMTFRDTDAKFAADAANAYAAAAEASVFEENKATSEKAVAWLQAQAVSQRKLLADAESGLAEFRAKNNLDVLDGRKKSVEQSIATLSASGASLAGEIVMRNQLSEFLAAMKVQPDNAEALPNDVPGGDAIAKAVADRRAALAACADLAKRYTPEHPDFKAAKARVDAVHAQLLDEIRAAMAGIGTDLELLRKQSDALQKRVAEERTNLAELERQTVAMQAQLTAMQRERDALDVAYRGILTRIEEARLSADENTAIVRVVEPAEVPTTPMKRAAGPLLLFGCLLGLAGGLALALASEAIDDRVTSFADVELGIGVKVLGLIPRVPKAKRAELALASLSHDYGAIGEAFAGIRSLLNSARYRDSSRAILIASFAPMEGKTIVACNLAIGIAKRGEKTLLVDFDLRRPRLSGVFARPEP
ncbi:MAG: hypothetical protein AAB215_09080, partial [Planctomycetota bacterium]